jgi:hypothetical protein
MTRATRIGLAALAATIMSSPRPAAAQTAWTDRGYVNVSGFYQPPSSFSTTVTPIDFAEASIIDTSYKTGSVPGFDAGAGVRVWRNLAVGVDLSYVSKGDSGSIDAQIPHPFFFNRLRAVSGDASGLAHQETAVHVQALWMAPLRDRWQLALAGGPSWFSVRQDLVSDVTVTQTYPYDTATFASATTTHRSGSRIGFNVGADVAYRLRRHVGLGFGVTYSRGSVPLDDTLTVEAGGARVGGGLRFRF